MPYDMHFPFVQTYSKIEPYDLEDEAEKEIVSYDDSRQQKLKRHVQILQVILAILATLCLFLASRVQWREISSPILLTQDDLLLAPAGNTRQTWQYQGIYSQEPNEESEAAWHAIFPEGLGFVHHEILAPNVSGVAVFHELHCLHGIRMAYYNALSGTSNEVKPTPSQDSDAGHVNVNGDLSIHHVRHCFDYLRQALMCYADSNLEPLDWELRGTTGWGVERQCRDYDAVVQWSEHYLINPPTLAMSNDS